jgi:hypothetical protein
MLLAAHRASAELISGWTSLFSRLLLWVLSVSDCSVVDVPANCLAFATRRHSHEQLVLICVLRLVSDLRCIIQWNPLDCLLGAQDGGNVILSGRVPQLDWSDLYRQTNCASDSNPNSFAASLRERPLWRRLRRRSAVRVGHKQSLVSAAEPFTTSRSRWTRLGPTGNRASSSTVSMVRFSLHYAQNLFTSPLSALCADRRLCL